MINGKKTHLRTAGKNDAPMLQRWYRNGEVMKHAGFPDGLEESVDQLEESIEKSNASDKRGYFIIMNETLESIGECSYDDLVRSESVWVGIKICEPQKQGHGYGYDALCALIGYLFEAFYLKKININTLVENTRAQSLYKKIGFVPLFIDRDCWTDPRGVKRSAVNMELLREKFLTQTTKM